MRIIIWGRAEKELKKITKIDQIAIARKIRFLAKNLPISEEKLIGYKDIFRLRVGNYRIVYKKTSREIYIVLIHHRKDVYRIAHKLLG